LQNDGDGNADDDDADDETMIDDDDDDDRATSAFSTAIVNKGNQRRLL
jgi:hypothetical protein